MNVMHALVRSAGAFDGSECELFFYDHANMLGGGENAIFSVWLFAIVLAARSTVNRITPMPSCTRASGSRQCYISTEEKLHDFKKM